MGIETDDDGVAVVRLHVQAQQDAVWAVLANGWLYPAWVVGASRVRSVDPGWPGVDTKVHHSFGVWPVVTDDHTRVVAVEPKHLLVLQARGWPVGEGRVTIELAASADGTDVAMREDATHGPTRALPRPVRQRLVVPRQRETLRRLGHLAEGGA